MKTTSPFFAPEFECMSEEQLRDLQLERLQSTVRLCMNNSFYRDRFAEMGITPDDIKSVDDVRKLPFTTKDDLRANYPFGMTCIPLEDCVRLHSSMCFRIPLVTACSLPVWVSSMVQSV